MIRRNWTFEVAILASIVMRCQSSIPYVPVNFIHVKIEMLTRSLLVVALIVTAARAQVPQIPDSLRAIGDEISAMPESDIRVLGKARALLGASILSGDLAKADRILSYIDARFDSTRIVALSPRERLLVEFWVGRFDRVLTDPELAADLSWEPEPAEHTYRRPRLAPDRDLLLEDLLDYSREWRTTLIARTQAAALGDEQRDFLRIFATVLIGPDPSEPEGYRSFRTLLNEDADRFLGIYPRSPYETFVRRYMRVVLRPSPWSYGLGIALGGLRMEGEMSRWFTSGMSFDLWGEMSYRSWYSILWLSIGTLSEVRSSFTYQQVWNSGMAVSPSGAQLAFGYTFRVNRSIIITPHVGWAYVDISPPEQERSKTGFDGTIDFGAAVAGVNIDLPIIQTGDGELIEGEEQGYQMLRARFAVMPTSTHIPFVKGTMVSFTLSYGLFGRPIERDL